MFHVIMPTYNQRAFIEAAVASVIDQADRLIVVNDGSTDGTAEYLATVAKPAHMRVLHKTNGGTASAINAGFDALEPPTGPLSDDWITWVSSDNVHTPDWRTKMLRAASEGVGVVYTGFTYLKSNRSQHLFKPYDPALLIGSQNCFVGPSFIIRRDVWTAVGGHRGRISHDYDHWLRVEEECWRHGLTFVGLPASTCVYNAHDQRATVANKAAYDAHIWQAEAKKRRAGA